MKGKDFRIVHTLCSLLWVAVIGSVAAQEAKVPGVVIAHSPASSRVYLGSPGIAVLADGTYLAKDDEFGPATREREQATSNVYRSRDRGKTWQSVARIEGLFWASLFEHEQAVYLLGTDRNKGKVVILQSKDAGSTWTKPVDAEQGVLLDAPMYHCAPVPVLVYGGRIWRAFEEVPANGKGGLHACMLSAPTNANLLRASSWTLSNRVPGNAGWLSGRFSSWLEGNAVVSPEGDMLNILRVDCPSVAEKAAIVRVSKDGKSSSFDPRDGFIDFPGGAKKFTIRFDAASGRYWSLANWVPPAHRSDNPALVRNTLALIASPDARHWSVRAVVLYHPDATTHGFQYVDWLFDENDIVAVSRTAYDDGLGGAHRQHDANYLTFHRIEGFRSCKNTPAALASAVAREQSRPKVLILGDSISIGYLPYVRELLGARAEVLRPMSGLAKAENCDGTTKGLKELDRWLAMEPWGWDVIHFNFGLHDLKRVNPQTGAPSNNRDDPRQADPDKYAEQLRQIVKRLKATDAKLIFATTTPVPEGQVRPHRDATDPKSYNERARAIMEKEDVAVDDLYTLALEHLNHWQLPVNVHFRPEGSRGLAGKVAEEIDRAVGE